MLININFYSSNSYHVNLWYRVVVQPWTNWSQARQDFTRTAGVLIKFDTLS
jgi:hypothetical protein